MPSRTSDWCRRGVPEHAGHMATLLFCCRSLARSDIGNRCLTSILELDLLRVRKLSGLREEADLGTTSVCRSIRGPVRASLSSVVIASAQMRNPHYSVAEILDSPWGYVALMTVPIGLYLMFKILLWDYRVCYNCFTLIMHC